MIKRITIACLYARIAVQQKKSVYFYFRRASRFYSARIVFSGVRMQTHVDGNGMNQCDLNDFIVNCEEKKKEKITRVI